MCRVDSWGAVNQRIPTIGDPATPVRSLRRHLAPADLSPRTTQSSPPPAPPSRHGVSSATATVGSGPRAGWRRGSSGNVYVADADDHRVQRFRPVYLVDPTVDLRAPAAGAVFEVGAEAFAGFSCDDTGGSGLDTCVGTVADGAAIDTSTGGERTFTVTATDRVGNETVVVRSFTCPARSQRSVMACAATAGVAYHVAVDGYRDPRSDVTLNWSMT